MPSGLNGTEHGRGAITPTKESPPMVAIPDSWNVPQIGACRHCRHMRRNSTGEVLLCSYVSLERCERVRGAMGACGPEAKLMQPTWEAVPREDGRR